MSQASEAFQKCHSIWQGTLWPFGRRSYSLFSFPVMITGHWVIPIGWKQIYFKYHCTTFAFYERLQTYWIGHRVLCQLNFIFINIRIVNHRGSAVESFALGLRSILLFRKSSGEKANVAYHFHASNIEAQHTCHFQIAVYLSKRNGHALISKTWSCLQKMFANLIQITWKLLLKYWKNIWNLLQNWKI